MAFFDVLQGAVPTDNLMTLSRLARSGAFPVGSRNNPAQQDQAQAQQPAGPIVNNAGVVSDAGGTTGFRPIGGGVQSTPGESSLMSLGYARNADNSLRRLGTPYDQQLNLMNELQRMAQSSAPAINAQDMETRNQQEAARNAYMNNQMGNLMQHFAPGILTNQIGQGNLGIGQGQLALEQAKAFGTPSGTPGSIANAASDAANRTRENERYGPQARYDAFYNAAYNAFPPGTPHAARVRQLAQGQGGMPGLAPPEFLTGRAAGGATGGPLMAQGGAVPAGGGVPRPIPPANNASANAVDTAFETGLAGFPRDATNTPIIPRDASGQVNQPLANAAITRIMGGLTDQQLRDPEVRQRLITQFGPDVLDNWLNTSGNLFNTFSIPGQQHQAEIRRFMGLAGMRQTPISPFTPGAGLFQRAASVNPLGQAINWGLLR